MKNQNLFSRTIVLAVFLAAFILTGLSVTCKTPEHGDDYDTLLNSPAAPGLIAPVDSYNFMTSGNMLYYTLRWDAVDSADGYELVMNNYTIILDSNSFLGVIDQNHFGMTRWRVRAASARWKTGYTEWSDSQTFFTSHPPFPPDQFLPPWDAQIVSDSVTAYVGFEWGSVIRSQSYLLEIYHDSSIVYSVSMPQLWDSVYLDDTGRYEWRVQAGSSLWQMPGLWSPLSPFSITRP